MTAISRLRPLLASTALGAVLAVPVSADLQQQRQPARDIRVPALAGACVLGGIVTSNDAQARPIRRAMVNVSAGDIRAQRMTATDDRGRFVIANLPPGRYTVTVTKAGWVTTIYGARRAGRGPGIAIALTEGQPITDLDVKLTPGAVISGRVLDENGVPQQNVRPLLLQYRTLAGERVLTQASPGAISVISMMTDDRGEYRMFGLAPGTYYVAASMPIGTGRLTTTEEVEWAQQRPGAPGATGAPPPGPMIAYPAMYYPGTSDLQQASPITLGPGEERGGVDLMLQPVTTARVAGAVVGPDGQPARGVQIVLNATGARSSVEAARQTATSTPAGTFEFASVIPGRYTLSARGSTAPVPLRPAPPPPPPPPGGVGGGGFIEVSPVSARTMDLWASSEVTVSSQDVTGLSIALEPGLTIAGRVAFDASTMTPPADLSRVQITIGTPRGTSMATPGLAMNMQTAPIRPDGTFAITGVAPDNYMITGFVPGGSPDMPWIVKSVMLGTENVADRPVAINAGARLSDVVITFTDRHAELSGRLVDTAGRPAPEFFVFVFSTNRAYWTPNAVRHLRPPTRPASDGTYRIAALPPGEYFVAALTEVDDTDIFDAAFLEQVAAAALKISVGEGEKKRQDLQIGRR